MPPHLYVRIMKKFILFWAIIILVISCGSSSSEYKTEESTETVSVTVIEGSESWDGSALPQYPEGTPKVTLLKITIPPKAKLDVHLHPIINVGYMTKGELVVTSETGEKLHLKTGDGIIELVNKYHYGENPNDEIAEIIVFYVGDPESVLTVYK